MKRSFARRRLVRIYYRVWESARFSVSETYTRFSPALNATSMVRAAARSRIRFRKLKSFCTRMEGEKIISS